MNRRTDKAMAMVRAAYNAVPRLTRMCQLCRQKKPTDRMMLEDGLWICGPDEAEDCLAHAARWTA